MKHLVVQQKRLQQQDYKEVVEKVPKRKQPSI